MTGESGAGPWVIAALPAIFAFSLFQTIPLLRESRESNALAFVLTMTLALIAGVILHRRMTAVRDHEYHRMRSQRRLGGLFQREDRGMWSSVEIQGPGGTAELGPLGQAALERMDQDVGALVRMRTTEEIPLADEPPEIEMLIDRIMPPEQGDPAITSDGMSPRSDLGGQTSTGRVSPLRRFSDWRVSRKRRRLERLAASIGMSVEDFAPGLSSSAGGRTPALVVSQTDQSAPVHQTSTPSIGGGSCPLCGAIGAISGGSCQRCGASFDRVG